MVCSEDTHSLWPCGHLRHCCLLRLLCLFLKQALLYPAGPAARLPARKAGFLLGGGPQAEGAAALRAARRRGIANTA